MKKGIQESNPVLALWQRVILDGRVIALAKEFRKKLNIPDNGFKSDKEFDIWIRKVDSILEPETKFFIEKSRKIVPYEGILTDNSFKYLIFKYLINGKIENEDLNSLKYSGMRIVTIKDRKLFYPPLKETIGEIDDGVYIKIKDFSTIDNILKYIQNNKAFIRNSLKVYAESKKLIKPKRMKVSSNFYRDMKILFYNQYSKKELEGRSGIKAKDKNILISLIMKEFGYIAEGEADINTDIIKIVKQRSKLKK